MTTLTPVNTDVLIIGAGPTGLTLANLLGQAGLRTTIIDRKAGTVTEPRAVSIDDESLRTMQAAGLADAVLADVVKGYGVHYFDKPGGRCFGKVEPVGKQYGYPKRNAFRQPLFERTLKGAMERFPSLRSGADWASTPSLGLCGSSLRPRWPCARRGTYRPRYGPVAAPSGRRGGRASTCPC